jgi:hypothetical protein
MIISSGRPAAAPGVPQPALTITITTHYRVTVRAILNDLDLLDGQAVVETPGLSQLIICTGDELYREWAAWISAAIGAGLINGGHIERW